jgi:tetratricopeptide (TPR) repeat protein
LATDFPKVVDYQHSVGGALNNRAIFFRREARHEEARQDLVEAITWQEKAVSVNPKNSRYREFLANHYGELGNVLQALASPDEVAARAKAVDHRKSLLAVAQMRHDQHSQLGADLNDWAMTLIRQENCAAAHPLLEDAIAAQRLALKADPLNKKYRSFMRNHVSNLSRVQKQLKDRTAARETMRQAVEIGEGLVADFPDEVGFRVHVAHDHESYALLLDDVPQGKEKTAAFERSVSRWQELVDLYPKNTNYRRDLALASHNLAISFARNRDFEKARPLMLNAVAYERVAYELQPKSYRGRLFQFHETLMKVLFELNDHVAAAKAAEQLVELAGDDWKRCY